MSLVLKSKVNHNIEVELKNEHVIYFTLVGFHEIDLE